MALRRERQEETTERSLCVSLGRYRCISAPGWDSEDRRLTDAEYLDELASHAAKSRAATLTHPDNRLMNDLDGYLRGLNFGRGSDPRFGDDVVPTG